SCDREFEPWAVDHVCPRCGPVAGAIEVLYDYRALSGRLGPTAFADTRRISLWRYESLLPLSAEYAVPLRAGWTPLYPCPSLAAELGLSAVWLKDDTLNPTASCKDRGTAVTIAAARMLERDALVCASTGNAATSTAGFCAAAGIPCYIFVPQSAPRAKVAQLLAFGAVVFAVDGTYGDAYDLAMQAADRFGWYNRSDGQNPMVVEGNKTAAFEVWEELHRDLPDVAVVAAGDGSVVAGIAKGFQELVKVGLAERVPQVYGVQAHGASAVAHAFSRHQGGKPILPAEEGADTVADSIRVGKPQDVVRAVRAVAETGGGFVTVTDDEIVSASQELARRTGVFAEPSGAAPYAGLLRLLRDGAIPPGARVTLFITGSGLKDPEGALRGLSEPAVIPPRLEAVAEALG
ncbi:TPA: threonine synthase, partial [Candidatus Acetothermia bacterium]|nr:threonine synthase [Candidatus Acetothermia bacterium]